MIEIDVSGSKHVCDSSINSWIQERYRNIQEASAEFWFIISIKSIGVDLRLPSAGAPRTRGKLDSCFNSDERRIIAMWRDMGVAQGNDIRVLLNFLDKLKREVA